jgi:gas vesicle protein GvpL/GvpF
VSTYVYAFAASTHPLPVDDVTGVGVPAASLRVIRDDDLAAVISDAPEGLRAKRRDLETHQKIIDALADAGPVLPMRFGTVAPDDDAVERELASGRVRYQRLLARVEGKVELNVKAVHDEDAVVRDVLFADAQLRRRNEVLRARGGGSYEQRLEFGESVAAAVEDRRRQDAAHVVGALRPHAAATTIGPPVDGCFVNASFLIAVGDRQRFADAVARLRRALPTVAELRLHGPLPPYSFVTADADHDAER